MNESSNPSLIADPDAPPTQGAFPVWLKVFTRPGEQTFLEILAHPEAKAKSAYLWVFLAGTLTGLISGLVRFVGALIGLRQIAPEIGQVPGASGILGMAGLTGALCGAPLTGLFMLIGFIISVAIVHGTAKFLGGQGNFDQLTYAFGAVYAPLSLLSGLLLPLNLIPFVSLCLLPLLLLLSLYAIYLEVAAIKAVHRFGWGGAIASLLLPTVLLGLLCGVLFVGLWSVAGPSFNEIFRQFQQIQPGLQ